MKKVKHWGLKHDKWRFPWISTRKDDLRNSCFELRAWSWDKWNPYLKAPKFLFSFGLQHNWRWFSRFKNRHLLSHPQHSYILRWKLLFSVSSKAATSSLAHLVNMVTCNSVRKPPQDWSIFFQLVVPSILWPVSAVLMWDRNVTWTSWLKASGPRSHAVKGCLSTY